MNKEKWLSTLLIAGLVSVGTMIGGCGGSEGGSGSNVKSEITVAMNAEPESYDIAKSSASVAKTITLGNVYEMLVEFDENYKAQPELAEKIDVNDNYTEYTYHLRQGVKFHNGQEMKADDVVASMNRWIKANGLVRASLGNAQFEKVDDYTVKITLAQPLMTFNELIAGMKPLAIIVPKSVIDNADPKTGMIKDYIGTGPYKVGEIKSNSYIKLEKFDDYKPYGEKGKVSGWSGYKEAKTPTVIFDFVPDSSTRVAGMQSGEYDMAVQMPFDDYSQFDNNNSFKVYKEEQGDVVMIYNKKTGIASNKKIREAINTALNREDIMRASYSISDFYKVDCSIITSNKNQWYTTAGEEAYNPANAERAKELLKEAGYNGEPFRLMVSSNYQEYYNAAVVIENQLKNAGVNVQLDVVDWSTYLTKAKDANAYDAFVTGGPNWVVPNAVLYLSPTWNGWSNDEKLQSMMSSMAHDTNLDSAKSTWTEIQKYCLTDYVPYSKLGNRYIYDVSSSKVKDLAFFEGPHMWNVTVAK